MIFAECFQGVVRGTDEMALDGATLSAAVGFALGCFFGTVTFGARKTARAPRSKFFQASGPS